MACLWQTPPSLHHEEAKVSTVHASGACPDEESWLCLPTLNLVYNKVSHWAAQENRQVRKLTPDSQTPELKLLKRRQTKAVPDFCVASSCWIEGVPG